MKRLLQEVFLDTGLTTKDETSETTVRNAKLNKSSSRRSSHFNQVYTIEGNTTR